MVDLHLGESGLKFERASDFDAVSLTANFDGFVIGRSVAERHSHPERVREAGQRANEIDEVGVVPGNFNALVVPKSHLEEQRTVEWARELAADLLEALAAIEAKALWMTHFIYPHLPSAAIPHICGILDVFSVANDEALALEKVLIDVNQNALEPGAELRNKLENAGYRLEPDAQFFLESSYRLTLRT